MIPNPYWIERRLEDLLHLRGRDCADAKARLVVVERELRMLVKDDKRTRSAPQTAP